MPERDAALDFLNGTTILQDQGVFKLEVVISTWADVRVETIRNCRKTLVTQFDIRPSRTLWRRAMFKGRHFDRSVLLLCVRWYLLTA